MGDYRVDSGAQAWLLDKSWEVESGWCVLYVGHSKNETSKSEITLNGGVASRTVTATQPASTSGTQNPPSGGGTGGGGSNPPGGGAGGGNPPPNGGQVEIDGRVGSLRGTCPNLTFAVNGSTIITDSRTRYSGGNGKHVEEGRRVFVAGQQSAGRVSAERIDIEEKELTQAVSSFCSAVRASADKLEA